MKFFEKHGDSSIVHGKTRMIRLYLHIHTYKHSHTFCPLPTWILKLEVLPGAHAASVTLGWTYFHHALKLYIET